ncbi:hypothetical protein ETD83_26805 [Actinomadura soli]|uniref:Uncharacterized protein n=1 Tax=Actinomadura soli TaxID=2508997 RepID=A0A5C4J683_9ACTN|nr:hypothetical protein [Actinomadura soli]TMQ92653.1 hypothetical protein ETD83_26805 [Actinomadura soli]
MSSLAFTCSYTTAKDAEGTSPCGRRATGRKGDPKCLGHWSVSWLMEVMGGTEHARRTYANYLLVAIGISVALAVRGTFDGDTPPLMTAGLYLQSLFLGGVLLALELEHPIGGTSYLLLGPAVGAIDIIIGIDTLQQNPSARPGESANALGVLEGYFYIAVGFAIISMWSHFGLTYAAFDRLANLATLAWYMALVMLAVSAVATVVISGGSDWSLLTFVIVIAGVAIVARGITHIKKLVSKIRV